MNHSVKEIIRIAIYEDIGHGDITSLLVVSEDNKSKAHIVAKEDFILAGIPFVNEVFAFIDPKIDVKVFFKEGSNVKNGDVIAEISGNGGSLLAGERIALNILQRISGIATLTKSYVNKLKGLHSKISDTRKTTPGMRFMEKYGVRVGGGINHRFGLYDGVLIKDNHIKIAGSVRKAIELAKMAHHMLKIEVEVKNLDELKEAIDAKADVIMLDNMSIADIRGAVLIRNAKYSEINSSQFAIYGQIIFEASGNVSLENVRSIAETGVDIISVGEITHSAKAADISMKVIHSS